MIQDVFPEIDPDQREILQSGIGPQDFRKITL
jgi:hypothetical protein